MINDITTDTEDGMKKAVESFKRDLTKIRTGRANTAMLDGIKVDYYGTPTPVNQVATVQVVDARLITVKPWEKNMIPIIDKAIRASDLGINPVSDAEQVRLPIPPLTQERRRDVRSTARRRLRPVVAANPEDHVVVRDQPGAVGAVDDLPGEGVVGPVVPAPYPKQLLRDLHGDVVALRQPRAHAGADEV